MARRKQTHSPEVIEELKQIEQNVKATRQFLTDLEDEAANHLKNERALEDFLLDYPEGALRDKVRLRMVKRTPLRYSHKYHIDAEFRPSKPDETKSLPPALRYIIEVGKEIHKEGEGERPTKHRIARRAKKFGIHASSDLKNCNGCAGCKRIDKLIKKQDRLWTFSGNILPLIIQP